MLLYYPFAQAGRITLSGAQEKNLTELLQRWWGPQVRFIEDLKNGEVVSWAEANPAGNQQSLKAKVVGLHPRSCSRSLKKISRYEDYHLYMSFVKESSYLESKQQVRYVLDHPVLPFPMVLAFQIPRITTVGTTQFNFPSGIFTGLMGTIQIDNVGNRCIYFLTVNWQGKSTGLPDMVVSTFAQTLTKIGLEHLIRISSF